MVWQATYMTYINTKKHHSFLKTKVIALAAVFALLAPLLAAPFLQQTTSAASLTDTYIRLDRMKTNTTDVDVMVVFTVPAGNSGTEDRVEVTFPGASYFTVDATPTITSTGCPGGTTALPGSFTVAGASQVVTVTGVTNLSASTTYCFIIDTGVDTGASAIPNSPVSAGVATIKTKNGGTDIDSTQVGLKTVTDDTVVVNATVPPYLQFTLSGNTDTLALDAGAIVSSGSARTVNIKTNSANGWVGWVKSLNAGLSSVNTGTTIASGGSVDGTPTTLTAGSEGFGLDASTITDSVTAGTGTVFVDGEYNGSSNQVGTLTTSYNRFAYADGPTDDDFVTLRLRSTISALTKAASDYTDTLFVIGAGNF